ncbi:MAG: DEAD/DEAH box helicase family protein [Oscillibacter sp.]|nr:DEAD/DEAH box helicase family protein [Oscillibacter sp.]
MAEKRKSTGETDGQISIYELLCGPESAVGGYSSTELETMIRRLREAQSAAREREEAERRRAEQEEQRRLERERREKKRRHVQSVTAMRLPPDHENAFLADARAQGVHAGSVSDALILSLTTLGKVDIEYISAVTGEDYGSVIRTLKGAVYQNPETWGECFYKGWETAEEYLSGNLIRKLNAAKEADREYEGYFSDNVRAIQSVLPPAVAAEDIYVTLASPWVPPDVIDAFMLHLFGDPSADETVFVREMMEERWATVRDEITGEWLIPEKSRYGHSVAVRQTYGTNKLEALHIIERTLNGRTIAVTKEVKSAAGKSRKKRVVDRAETIAAIERQDKLIKAFQAWVWTDEQRKRRLMQIYEEKFGRVRRRVFDGSFLTFPGMSREVELYPYQKDAVARILFTPNTLLAHDVGAGKTYVMIAAGQEMRRMGISRKNLYVVPNNIVGQWQSIFKKLYPDAELLCVEPKAFTPQKREAVLREMRDGEHDGIIIAYSCYEKIPLSKRYRVGELERKRKKILDAMQREGRVPYRLIRKREEIDGLLLQVSAETDAQEGICFDDLGITTLFVDEAHNFKNVPFTTSASRVLGINSTGSKRCADMMEKALMVQDNGGGVVLATGTPVTNSITDAFIMQQYLQSDELIALGIRNFDSWAGMFAERVTEFEIDVDTNSYRVATRFAKFHNLPELTALLAAVADFHPVDKAAGIPRFAGYTDVQVEKSPAFSEYLSQISERAERVRGGHVNPREDNMLKITTDGRKAALDMRLVDPHAESGRQSKIARCVENVAEIYFRTERDRSTQIVFCDISTPKTAFNVYWELKARLAERGIPKGEIAFIHDAGSEAERLLLFERVRRGDVRVLIGSTFKLGLGVNVQERLIALHHIDVPWRPSDMTQREGRILRQGNTNGEVFIYRYITKGSFDAYS